MADKVKPGKVLAKFQCEATTWEIFQAKAKANGTNASTLLNHYVQEYLEGNRGKGNRGKGNRDELDERINHRIQNAISPLAAQIACLISDLEKSAAW